MRTISQSTNSLKVLLIAYVAAMPMAHLQGQDLPFSSTSTGVDGPYNARYAPPAVYFSAAAYDAAQQNTVLFAGLAGNSIPNSTFTWNGTNWSQISPFTQPGGRCQHGMAYDAARQQVVLFGGDYDVNFSTYLNDTWLWNGTNWTNANPATSPSQRREFAMAYDAARGQTVLFGGYYGSPLNDTWTWNGTNWTQASPATPARERRGAAVTYDSVRQRIVMFGGYDDANGGQYLGDTWSWDGSKWTQLAPKTNPPPRYGAAMVYDESRQKIVLFGGYHNGPLSDAWLWDGTNWSYFGANTVTYDMSSHPSGIWNYTSINVDSGVTVTFEPNAANSPIQWLASGFVTINGTLNLVGANAGDNPLPGNEATGGPGGFSGGLSGIRFDQSGSYAGTPGQGPGGGLPGTSSQQAGVSGTYQSTYGNAYIQPLIGGSGGGGSASGPTQNGYDGGGGGGAIYISSSRDITVNGAIFATGGSVNGQYVGSPQPYWSAGAGSGGAIRLQADRVLGSGTLNAAGGNSPGYGNADNGWIRIEAFYRTLAGSGNITPVSVSTAPVTNQNFNSSGALVITGIAGQNVVQPPSGNTQTPDVIFTATGPITVNATASGIPNGTPVVLRVTSSGQVIFATNTLASGGTSFNVTVPAGVGTVQASANFTIGQ